MKSTETTLLQLTTTANIANPKEQTVDVSLRFQQCQNTQRWTDKEKFITIHQKVETRKLREAKTKIHTNADQNQAKVEMKTERCRKTRFASVVGGIACHRVCLNLFGGFFDCT